MISFADNMKITDGFQECVLVSWEYLLRVQSEAIGLELGTVAEVRENELAEGRHSAVWLSMTEEVLHLLLKRRKHGPKGSWLMRPCTCKVNRKALVGPQF